MKCTHAEVMEGGWIGKCTAEVIEEVVGLGNVLLLKSLKRWLDWEMYSC